MYSYTQLYIPIRLCSQSNTATLHNCLAEIKSWMSHNFLQLNLTKSDVTVHGPPAIRIQIMSNPSKLATYNNSSELLGEFLTRTWVFWIPSKESCQVMFLKNTVTVKFFISTTDLEKLMHFVMHHLFIFPCLNDCDSVYACTQSEISSLQLFF